MATGGLTITIDTTTEQFDQAEQDFGHAGLALAAALRALADRVADDIRIAPGASGEWRTEPRTMQSDAGPVNYTLAVWEP